MEIKVLLYYKYQAIEDPEKLVEEHRAFCAEHNLKGRILIAKEGINGTCAGAPSDIEKYKKYVHAIPGFEDMWFKENTTDHNPFPKAKVHFKSEIVALKVDGLDPQKGGNHLSPKEYHELIGQDNVVVFDVRNNFEWEVGKFEGAICADIETFRELPKELEKEKYQDMKDKKVLLYCTGGIRCEKATHMFKEKGFKDVSQLNGGIYNYCQEYPNGKYEGTCFVFDDRLQVAWDENGKDVSGNELPDEKIISHCNICQEKCGRIVNDERVGHVFMVCCEKCDEKHDVSRVRYQDERDAKKISTE
jgi:UPF0176 protein